MKHNSRKFFACCMMLLGLGVSSCSEVSVPDSRNVKIPSPVSADERRQAVNERPDSVMYLPLGEDILVPERVAGDAMPSDEVGPFELRSETLAGALQLILADYDVSIAFESELGLNRKVTVANLRGPLDKVVDRVCSLADLYCSYEDGTIVVKDTQTFSVTLPPLADAEGNEDYLTNIIQGLTAVIGDSGRAPVSDPTTRTLIYTATQRTAGAAENYFQRLRANTAMIVFETYIWEVSLNSGNSTGINWDAIETFGKFNASLSIAGNAAANFTNPVSIGLPTTKAIGATPTDLVEFLAQYGAVKTISQPQISVLSGSSAQLRVADTENYVSEVTSTINNNNTTTSVSTDSVDSGFTLDIGSSWDKSTVYANVGVNLTNVVDIEDFTFSDSNAGGTDTIIQLPQTTERELNTQIRVRPGDSVLIAGLVRETDNFNSRGPGFMEPVIPDSRTAQTENLELVIMLRPRVIVYTSPDDERFKKFVEKKMMPVPIVPAEQMDETFTTSAVAPVEAVQQAETLQSQNVAPLFPETLSETQEDVVTTVVESLVETTDTLPQTEVIKAPPQSFPVAVAEDVQAELPLSENMGFVLPQDEDGFYNPQYNSGYLPGYNSLQEDLKKLRERVAASYKTKILSSERVAIQPVVNSETSETPQVNENLDSQVAPEKQSVIPSKSITPLTSAQDNAAEEANYIEASLQAKDQGKGSVEVDSAVQHADAHYNLYEAYEQSKLAQ